MWPFKPKPPPPGSEQAGDLGCTCPPTRNNNGLKKPEGGWVVRGSCPIPAHHAKDMKVMHEIGNPDPALPSEVKVGFWERHGGGMFGRETDD